jgi:hypothetical protein
MTTARQLRQALLSCAADATKAEPANVEYRLHSFVAKLSGSMASMGEPELDKALWALFGSQHPDERPDTQAAVHAVH